MRTHRLKGKGREYTLGLKFKPMMPLELESEAPYRTRLPDNVVSFSAPSCLPASRDPTNPALRDR